MRIPTVEFRSLLLPPIRVPLRALQSLRGPQSASWVPHAAPLPLCTAQRRTLHLYKTAKAKTVLGQHKVLTFSGYEIAPPSDSDHRINLYHCGKNDRRLIAENISLEEAYDKHVTDGKMLFCIDELKKSTAENFEKLKSLDIPAENNNFALIDAHTHRIPLPTKQKGYQLGGLKIIVFNLSSPIDYVKLSLDRAYQFIESGAVVEVRTRMKGKQLTKEERIQSGDFGVWPWMHAHFPHLRPDFVLKAMPKDTTMLIKPVSDGRIVQWVMSPKAALMPRMNLNRRLFRVKESVKQSIQQGKQGQLPKTLRAQLRAQGLDDYSVNTGMPRGQAREKFANGGKVKYGAEEKKHMRRSTDEDRDEFLQVDPELAAERTFTITYEPVGPRQETWNQRGSRKK
ncbi:hypothetical protein BDW02DRAFT_115980 [Decorospora gaudefroyi]|uniref:Uncharacterized protein n=1 Tax=Decorospora gaudefroyi TaxID=184978 RepID=A0A6A5JYJ0_9PLEO|nr:hypothetical protein BDW02DRAFT_115980 [Decorospora gaudefroyi]